MKKRTAWILVAGVVAVAVGAAAVGAIALLVRGGGRPGTGWASRSYLYLDLQGEIPEQPASETLSWLERRPPSLRTLVESLDRAATDANVSGVVLRVGWLTDAGWGKVQELRDAVLRYRRSGKPAYAHVEFCGNKEYYLATACDRIYAVPTALIDVTGLAAEVTFFKGTLDKLGVEAQFEAVGRYKSAPDQYTQSGFTDPHREQMEALVDSLYEQYVAAIARGRNRKPEEVQALVDAGPYDGPEALAAGLVDELLYADQIEERLKEAERVTPGRYVRSTRGFGFDGRPRVAVVYAVGEIIPGSSQTSPFGGTFAGSETIAAALRQARRDATVKAIVLRVDSPGGSGTASDVIWREVLLTRRQKPVVVSMGDYAASGGYYIAMGSDAIVAQPGTLTGSIGVFGGKFSLRGLYDKIGLTQESLTRGAHAGIYSEYRPWTDEERAQIRRMMETFYRDFVARAAEGRKKTYEELDALAQGRVWTGAEAKGVGLVDYLGGLETAVSVAKEKARIAKDQPVALVVLPERKGLLETIFERQEDGVEEVLPADLLAVLRWARLLSGREPVARMPFELRVR